MQKTIRVFNSFGEAERAEIEERAAMTPEQRLEAFFQPRERVYPNASQKRLERVCRIMKLEQG